MIKSAAESIAQCRRTFGPAPRAFSWSDRRNYARIPKPGWMDRKEPLRALLREQDTLLKNGRVVWGAMVQANTLLFRPGDEDHPADVIYSPEPDSFDDRPDELLGLARKLFSLKGTVQGHGDLAAFSKMLANEMDRETRMRLPRRLAGTAEVYDTTIVFARRHLPDGILHDALLPLIICPEKTDWTMMLPSRYWPSELIARHRA